MPSPFPGMDPYLEHPELWPDVHLNLVVEFARQLTKPLRPRYVARICERCFTYPKDDPGRLTYLPSDADPNAARHRFIELRRISDRQVVTIIEVLCPSDKMAGSAAREAFFERRSEVRATTMNWLEIDLLRAGLRTDSPDESWPMTYRAYLERWCPSGRELFEWPISLRTRLPKIHVPLDRNEQDVVLDLQAALETAYERAAYDLDVDYTQSANPPLDANDAAWAQEIIRKRLN